MKRLISRAGLIAVMLFSFSLQGVLAKTDKVLEAEALELSAGMEVLEWEAVYVPLRDLAKAADKEGRLKDAADLWVRAAYKHRMPAYRAAALRNAGFYSSRIGDCDRARDLWKKAIALLELMAQDETVFEGAGGKRFVESRTKTLADSEWGLKESACGIPDPS